MTRRPTSPNTNGSVVRALDDANLPGIAGRWSMNITWQRGEKTGDVKAAAIIREESTGISMEVQSKNSDSRTIFARYEPSVLICPVEALRDFR